MEKVYCKNCKWYWAIKKTERGSRSLYTYYYCDPCSTIKYSSGILGFAEDYNLEDLFNCSEHNKNNDCIYYKRKWWKFGV